MMMIDAMEGSEVGGKLVKDVRFADDQGMVAGSEGGLHKLMNGLNRTAKEYDMKANIKKTKVMKVSRKVEGVIKREIKTSNGRATYASNQRKELLSKKLNNDIKKRIIKAI